MRLPPDDMIATWPAPNYDNPETQGPYLLVVQLVMMPLALLALLARLYVRVYLMKKVWVDDWLMLSAMVRSLSISFCLSRALLCASCPFFDCVCKFTKLTCDRGSRSLSLGRPLP